MKRLLLLTALCLVATPLASCARGDNPLPTPSDVADKTTLDESLGRGANLAYKAARVACELAVDLGKIKGTDATHYRDLNRRAYAAVLDVDKAYATANAKTYGDAVDKAQALSAELLGLAIPKEK